MAVGAFFLNESGSLQIDGNDRAMVCIQNGTLSLNQQFPYGYGTPNWMATVSVNSPTAVLAISRRLIWSTVRTATQTTWEIVGFAQNEQIPYYIFDALTPQPSTYGMQMFNAAGTLTFDALVPPMLIREVIKVEDTTNITRTYTPGRKYAYSCGGRCLSADANGGSGDQGFPDGEVVNEAQMPSLSSNGTGHILSVNKESIIEYPHSGSSYYTPGKPFDLIVIDVTGI